MLELPTALRDFAESLERDGVTLYAVGGSVRDALLGREVHDVDLASRLRPEEMLERAKANGVPARIVQQTLGTVLLTIDGTDYEHTTFRTESYGAGGVHRPDAVRFSDSPEVDAFRRDFSVNALYESVTDGTILDPTGGLADLENRVLRTTTKDPAVILRDDGLRILRLVRFAAALDFSIDPLTLEAAKANAALLDDVAWERRRQELDRILTGERVFYALSTLHDVGALPYLLPELVLCEGMEQRKDYHKYDVLTHLFHTCENTPEEPALRLAGLLHDVGKPEAYRRDGKLYAHDVYGAEIARTMLKRLRYPNALIERVCGVIRIHMFDLKDEASDATIRKRFAEFGRERTEDLIAIREADIRGSGYQTDYVAERWRKVLQDMINERVPFSEEALAVTGRDIMEELGIPAGERVGTIKRRLLLHCAVHPEENRREILLKRMHDCR
ncbi:MAG: CCA tRNA nucleotidyltransferase [Clostridia bacterium]|nr:CCA tRNA nucleotidyltransferase [Clostridia bacterium]